jgi:hypothetical protein
MAGLLRDCAAGFTGVCHNSSSKGLEYMEKIRCKKPLSRGAAEKLFPGLEI